ncbi:ABC transporter substrate-binding protein [Nesterenkonia salmonea]|uniref:ABC transporter substrate-binding protein n=1 Tax=Nesterenkonia salmonea TaxID=1804987 RepID=A0A5R9B9Y5_9MICC|nr:ABC transporter substrate-binding protein [Nesterenkonia salmonea]TLP94483.1 ABC transporter substrate-binding protein [Nesterenkonia salmonea]
MRSTPVHKTGALLAGLVVAGGGLAACGSPDSQNGNGEAGEAAFTWAVTGADQAIHEAVADLWNEQNPDQMVNVEFLSPEADQQRQAMFQDLQSGTGAFDVLGLDVVWTGEFAEAGYIMNLEDHRAEVEGVSLDGAVESSSWENELFAMPYSSNAGYLYYRTDLVDEPPATWDEVLESGVEVGDEAGIGGYAGLGNQYEGFVVTFLQLFWSAGGEVYNDDQTESTFLEGDAAERALDFLIDGREQGLFASGFDSMVEDDARSLFQAGDSVYMHNWPYALPLLEGEDGEESDVAGDFDVAALPGFDENPGVGALGGLNNAVSELSDNQDVAEEFVVWAATDADAQQTLLDMSLPSTMLSTYDGADDPNVQLLGEILAEAQARPAVAGYNSLSLAIQENLHSAFLGQTDPEQALQAVDEAATDALSAE